MKKCLPQPLSTICVVSGAKLGAIVCVRCRQNNLSRCFEAAKKSFFALDDKRVSRKRGNL